MPEPLANARYEDCPHCKGTGKRIVPPPPEPGQRHGRPSHYTAGCRCDLCRAAWREYMRVRNREYRKNRRAERAS